MVIPSKAILAPIIPYIGAFTSLGGIGGGGRRRRSEAEVGHMNNREKILFVLQFIMKCLKYAMNS